MWRRILISILVVLVVGGTYVWFSLSPGKQVNLEATADMAAITNRLDAAKGAHLPVSFSGNEVKALAVQAIKAAKVDDRIKGVEVQLGQNSMTVSLAIDVGAKVLAVSAVARPVLRNNQLTIDLTSTKIGVVPVPAKEVLKRLGDKLPTGVSYDQGQLTIDLSQAALGSAWIDSLKIENGSLELQPK